MDSLVALRKYYSQKTVLVTGHTGFKGTWLCFVLKLLGAKVVGIGLRPKYIPNAFSILQLAERVIDYSEFVDIRDKNHLESVFDIHKPEVIFHLAAQALVKDSYDDPVDTYSTNVMGLVNVFEACRITSSVQSVVNVTSDKCYENFEWIYPYRENDRLGGKDPYSCSKACSELITKSYKVSFFQNTALSSARAGNVIGGGDWSDNRLIPDLVKAAQAGSVVQIRSPNSIRPWQHVLEPIIGYLLLGMIHAEKNECQGAWNFGPTHFNVKTVKEVVKLFEKNLGAGELSNFASVSATFHEAQLLNLDSTKAMHILGWQPRWDIEESVHKTAQWYKAFYENQDMMALTIAQIEDYLKVR
ncbi:CDP-glucose 4,6-dehydratase [Pseudoalteromonas xiamenensis]|uniref:CDP-glucose 4,6-dehydratase n=1 Tax=Pseudoalteromonas xiamenensis TaxID=882626 RepID=UPI0035EC622E